MSAEAVAESIPPGYKQTEVGVIPEDWNIVRALDACSKIQDGTHFSPQIGGNDYLYITSKNIRFGYLDTSTAARIDRFQHQVIYRRCDVKKGDLLLTKDGASTGNAAINNLDEEFSLLSSVAFLRFQQNQHCAAYFLQQILTSQGQRQIQDAMAGNAITRLTLEKIKKLRFPVPPTLAEQEAIATALSDTDALIESLEQLIAKKRQIKQGAMQELLTGKRRLPGFSGEWEVKALRRMVQVPVTDGPHLTPCFRGDGIPFLSVNNLVDNKIDLSDLRFISVADHDIFSRKCKPLKGDILLGKAASVGKVAIVDTDIEFNIWSPIALIRISGEYAARFIFYQLQSTDLIQQITLLTNSSSQGNIGMGDIEKLTFKFPSLPEQEAIATILSNMDAEITTLEEKLVKTRHIKQAMMQELLTGRIRLV